MGWELLPSVFDRRHDPVVDRPLSLAFQDGFDQIAELGIELRRFAELSHITDLLPCSDRSWSGKKHDQAGR